MNETKRSRNIQRRMNNEPQKKIKNPSQSNPICFKCGKVDHYKKDCKVKKKINNLNISKDLKDMLCKVILNSSEFESRTGSNNARKGKTVRPHICFHSFTNIALAAALLVLGTSRQTSPTNHIGL